MLIGMKLPITVSETLSNLVALHTTLMLTPKSELELEKETIAEEALGDTFPHSHDPAAFVDTSFTDITLTPSTHTVLCWLFRIFDTLFRDNNPNGSASINAFCTAENIGNLARLLYICGPSGDVRDAEELEVEIFDPRSFSWWAGATLDIGASSNLVLFRSHLLDVLGLVAASDYRLREYLDTVRIS